MKNKVLINGFTFKKAIEKLDDLSENWKDNSLKNLDIESQNDIDTVYDILIDSAIAFVNGNLTDAQINEIDIYYKKWYGYTIRSEE